MTILKIKNNPKNPKLNIMNNDAHPSTVSLAIFVIIL